MGDIGRVLRRVLRQGVLLRDPAHLGTRVMTADKRADTAEVEALAAVMTDADCSSSEYPFSDESRARAILASDWLARRLAEARAEGAQAVLAAVEGEIRDGRSLAYPVRIVRIGARARAAVEQAQP